MEGSVSAASALDWQLGCGGIRLLCECGKLFSKLTKCCSTSIGLLRHCWKSQTTKCNLQRGLAALHYRVSSHFVLAVAAFRKQRTHLHSREQDKGRVGVRSNDEMEPDEVWLSCGADHNTCVSGSSVARRRSPGRSIMRHGSLASSRAKFTGALGLTVTSPGAARRNSAPAVASGARGGWRRWRRHRKHCSGGRSSDCASETGARLRLQQAVNKVRELTQQEHWMSARSSELKGNSFGLMRGVTSAPPTLAR